MVAVTAIDELMAIAATQNIESEDMAIAMAAYTLGFCSYKGFVNEESRKVFYQYGGDKSSLD